MRTEASNTAEFIRVMNGTGFYRDGRPGTGVLTREALRDPASEKHFKYKTAVDKLGATAFFELSGAPCIYFKYLADAQPSAEQLTETHRLAWNHGLAPLLWVVTPTSVSIYNCYSRPETDDPAEHERHRIRVFTDIADRLDALNRFAGRLQYETGRFWRTEDARRIDRRQRVDESLLADLKAAEEDLVSAGLPAPAAHALLGRSIFVAYLQDRQILKPQFFRSGYGKERFTDVLRDKAKTETLWAWVRRTFNGDLFPLKPAERKRVGPRHLQIVRRLLEGTSRSGQMRLWPYRFDIIPVELISSIYEMFARSADAREAERLSTHYTPMNLVDLVLSQVFKDMPADGKVADLACGSGVFLVEALRRLVSLRVSGGEPLSRKLIRSVLHDQIFGVDIIEEAVQIAAFSLYLTVLELDPDPRPPSALKFRELVGMNLFAEDAFSDKSAFPSKGPFASKGFAAIVGNPPWTRTPSNSTNAEYCRKRGLPTARKGTPDQAFLWRIGDFVSDDTRIGLLLHAKPFFSHDEKARKAKQALLQRFTPELMLNLSELRQVRLFPTAMAPAMVFVARGQAPSPDATFTFGAARRYEDFRAHGIVEITPDCIKRLPLGQAASDADMLKVASWGSARDMALVRRIRDAFPPLSELAGPRPHGQGFKRSGKPKQKAPELKGKPLLSAGTMLPFTIDPDRLPAVDDLQFHRPRDPRIYEGPLVIATRGLRQSRFFAAMSLSDVVYDSLYYGFSLPKDEACFLNGILNSSLAAYWLFMAASTWGIERDELQPVDLLRLPVPVPSTAPPHLVKAVVATVEEAKRLSGDDLQRVRSRLDEAVFALYGIDDPQERVFVRDAMEVTIDHRRAKAASRALRPATTQDLTAYAEQLRGTLASLIQSGNRRGMVAEVLDVGASPLAVVRLRRVSSARQRQVAVTEAESLDSVLRRIEGQLRAPITDQVFAKRFLRVYGADDLHVVKPAELRYWTRSAALNDADEILAEHMGEDGAIR